MLAKIIARGDTRAEALARLRTALDVTRVLGVRTNLRFLRWLLDQPAMRDGEVRTDTIAGLAIPAPPKPDEATWVAVAAAARDAGLLPGGTWGGGWRLNAAPSVRLAHGDATRSIPLPEPGSGASASVAPSVQNTGTLHADVEGQSLEFRVAPAPTIEEAVRHATSHGEGAAVLTAPMPGRVIAVRAREGASVREHETVVVLEAMKMEHAVVAPLAGTLTRLAVAEGQQVQRGDVLAEVSASDG
jgi:acetyl-CoA/propionyl-CoA carboxylase biotin carboxyl carrier protein